MTDEKAPEVDPIVVACMTTQGAAHHRWEKCHFCECAISISKDGANMMAELGAWCACLKCTYDRASRADLENAQA